jgi:hypothetical protein
MSTTDRTLVPQDWEAIAERRRDKFIRSQALLAEAVALLRRWTAPTSGTASAWQDTDDFLRRVVTEVNDG